MEEEEVVGVPQLVEAEAEEVDGVPQLEEEVERVPQLGIHKITTQSQPT